MNEHHVTALGTGQAITGGDDIMNLKARKSAINFAESFPPGTAVIYKITDMKTGKKESGYARIDATGALVRR